ncbi:MAG: prepilin-type N-terminal cleavage/methylation domain-containing protein [Candidatus Omnitrophica bacterium]|nr:prepilin-type N-terminal cleavage/methylation domain-containing protein [Candidatus Omnitrophota bacterium]MBU4488434.1 prepilin-type N-terminal cleavage/methylation domain-containing protein [Candidatus Omnitrophota bacterium]MCG2705147.1 prepilin-type N-terminal cleavage/methylation domain-containing protein [Candidatus Omnitrophota bacterium]
MHNKAFTLIEITIALLILAIGIVGILTLFPVGFDASGRAANIIEATFLAQELIEDGKRCGYGIFDDPSYDDDKTATGWEISGDFSPGHPNYEYDIFVYNDATLGVDGLREVVVYVYWPAADGEPGARTNQKNVELSIYLAQYEM